LSLSTVNVLILTQIALWSAMARKFWVTVKPLAKKESVAQQSDLELVVSVHAPARDGKANGRLVEILADYFHTAKTQVRILHGHSSRKKLIEVD
jgi:uncharacterized protein